MSEPERDSAIRLAAFKHLEELSALYGERLPREQLLVGFAFDGEQIPLMHFIRGIWRPPAMTGAALSITTTPNSHYADHYDNLTGLLVYHYQGSDPQGADNVRLRAALRLEAPLIYFHGIAPGQYLACWPSFVRGDFPDRLFVHVALNEPWSSLIERRGAVHDRGELKREIQRGYLTRIARVRIHQEEFRARILKAYRTQCAFCRLRHDSLLNAAHIIPDSDLEGIPIVPNGMALCALHHAVFDLFFVAVRPDYTLEVRPDILRESDGPTLVHAVQALHGMRLELPKKKEEHPDPARLEARYAKYVEHGRAKGHL